MPDILRPKKKRTKRQSVTCVNKDETNQTVRAPPHLGVVLLLRRQQRPVSSFPAHRHTRTHPTESCPLFGQSTTCPCVGGLRRPMPVGEPARCAGNEEGTTDVHRVFCSQPLTYLRACGVSLRFFGASDSHPAVCTVHLALVLARL